MNDRRNALAFLGINAIGALAAATLPSAAGTARPGPMSASNVPMSERIKRHFPNVPLQTHDGRSVRFYDDLVKGKKVLINFVYTNCTITCPPASANLRRVQEMLGDRIGRDIFINSLTVDPERDTPAVLKAYARTFGARPGWTFATGRPQDLVAIRRRLGLSDTADYTQHMGLVTFGNEAEGKWGATPILDTPKNIVYYVLRRVDPFKYTTWPADTPGETAPNGAAGARRVG